MRKILGCSILSATSLVALQASASCGSAMCMLNTNWGVQGVWTEPGVRLDLRYEYIDQDQVMSGTSEASEEQLEHEHHREVETTNRNLLANIDYAFNERYGISLNIPLISREHLHLHHSHANPGVMEYQRSDFTELGDVRVLGRMQLWSSSTARPQNFGINLGIKLPTGEYDIEDDRGRAVERSMQPGSGTTDALVGAYYHQQIPLLHSQWFAQILSSKPLNERDDFKPGQQLGLDVGYRYNLSQQWHLMAQLNYLHKSHDEGDEAEPDDSGADTLFLSPGVSFALTDAAQIYGFVHHRLHEDVNGIQLSAKNSFVVGFSSRF